MMYRVFLTLIFLIQSFFGLQAQAPQFPSAQNLPPDFPQMSEKDFTEMVNFLDTLSDDELKELENLGRQVLTDMGYDADTLEPLSPNVPALKDLFPGQQQPAPQAPTEVTPTPVQPAEPIVNTDELEEYLKKFLRHLRAVQQKIQSPVLADRKLVRWSNELRDINFYITHIAHSEHIKRLLSKEYEPLLKHIKDLGTTLITYEPLLVIHEPTHEATDDSYEILGITPRATQDEIEQAYDSLKQKKSPELVKERLIKDGASERDIKRAVKEAQLTMSLITDAYEKLSDPKLREQLDRERLAHTQNKGALEKGSQKALDALTNGLTQSVYTNQLVNQLEEFMKKYEPQQLEQKKALEKAEAERKKEQLNAEQRRITKSELGKLEAAPRTAQEQYPNYPSYEYGGYQPAYTPEYQTAKDLGTTPQSDQATREQKTGAKKGVSGDKDKNKGSEKDKDKGGAQKDKGGEKKEKSEKDVLKDLFEKATKPFTDVFAFYNGAGDAQSVKAQIRTRIHDEAKKINKALDDFYKKIDESSDKAIKKEYATLWQKVFKPHEEVENTSIKKRFKALIDEVNDEVELEKQLRAPAAGGADKPEPSLSDVLKNKQKIEDMLLPKKKKS